MCVASAHPDFFGAVIATSAASAAEHGLDDPTLGNWPRLPSPNAHRVDGEENGRSAIALHLSSPPLVWLLRWPQSRRLSYGCFAGRSLAASRRTASLVAADNRQMSRSVSAHARL